MRTSEWVIVAYFAYLLAVAVARRAELRAVRSVAVLGLLNLALIVIVIRMQPSEVARVLRDWLPGGYLLVGYWAAGVLYRGPDTALEARLQALDARLFHRLGPAVLRAPRAVLECLELAYLLCYPLVPAGLAALYLSGRRAHADAFWTVVLAAAFAAYAVLPLAGTRPPRALGSEGWIDRRSIALRAVNLRVLDRGSIHVNTFPSGHAASAWAAALSVTVVPGHVWLAFAAIAACIGAGAIVGRYHYALDVLLGIAVAIVAFAVAG